MPKSMSRPGFRAHVAAHLFNTPMLVEPTKAEIIVRALAPELLGTQSIDVNVVSADSIDTPEKHAGVLGRSGSLVADCPRGMLTRRTGNGVAVIAVEGSLIHKGGWVGSYSGETSYQGLSAQIAEVTDDELVKGVVFEFDSFGGEVSGCHDCGSQIQELSEAKPTIAVCTDHAFSAAYWLAAQCRQIFVPEAGGVGSIGVVWVHTNIQKALANAGAEISILHAGEHKTDGNPFEPLPKEVRAEIEAELETVRNQFAHAVEAGRGKRLSAKHALATEARCFMGEGAVAAGLADAVARPSEAFEAFVNQF